MAQLDHNVYYTLAFCLSVYFLIYLYVFKYHLFNYCCQIDKYRQGLVRLGQPNKAISSSIFKDRFLS